MTPTQALLETKGLVKIYRRTRVVNGVSLRMGPGEIVGLLGPNGSGKTTTFRMIVGMISPVEGQVFLRGKDVSRLPMYKRARLGLGYLSQEPSIFRRMTVEQNILAILETMRLSRKERMRRLEELLEDLMIGHLRKSIAETLSGGERRRLEISRALATRPAILLLDEPFSGVDPIAVEEIQGILRDLRDKGIGILLTDHNVRETLRTTDRSYIIFEGKVLREGRAETLVKDEEVRRIYLGSTFEEGITPDEMEGLADS